MAIKVSVVVPAFRPGDGINRVVSSIESQTLPAGEFELIIVDDGSPDDTFQRLEAIRDAHSNVKIKRIENSGWPSRPRNVGIDMAQGEYVLFMDHDDYLYPDGLRSAYEFARHNRADILSPKESKTNDVGWGVTNFSHDMPNARETLGIASLLPMMPHKLYRRAFLNEHGIRFPEGRRMLWEDVYFNVEAYRYASVISVLSETPVYRWVRTDSNNSSTYGPGDQEFWDKLFALFAFIVKTLPGDEFADARESMILHQYHTRVLGRVTRMLATADSSQASKALANAQRILAAFVPPRFDGAFGKMIRARAALLRVGDPDLMRELSAFDASTTGTARTDAVRWENGKLVVDTVSRWSATDGTPLQFRRRDGRILRALPARLEEALPADVVDVTDEISAAATTVTLTSRHEHVTWAMPGQSEVGLRDVDGQRVEVSVRTTMMVDINAAVFGRPLESRVWDFHARTSLLGAVNHRLLHTDVAPQCALINGRAAVAYRHIDGRLSLDLQLDQRNIVAHGKPGIERATFTPLGWRRVAFTLPLDGVHIVGETRLHGMAGLWPFGARTAHVLSSHRVAAIPAIGRLAARILRTRSAVLAADGDGAVLTGVLWAVPGVYSLICRFGHHPAETSIKVRVSATGRIRFVLRVD